MKFSVTVTLLLCLASFPGSAAESVPFLSPQQATDKMSFPEGFNVHAYAAEPDVIQPFAFAFDDRGRLWVLENLNYESRGSDTFDQGPQGRIVILEDTNHDGHADRRKVFTDKIFFPTGLALGFGGVYVGSPPNLLFIPDRDGNDKPDADPEILLDGWARHDRHETLNSFTWGPDGWLYGLHGVFTHSNVGKPGTPDEKRQPINAGVWRFHPVSQEFEVFAWGTSNPWGLDFNEHGQLFITACVIPHLWHIQQGGRYQRQAGRHFNPYIYDDIKTIADHRHKSAHGGARFYLADSFPKPYQGRLFMCNIHQHAVLTDILERHGSGYVGRHGDDFLDSHDPQWLGFNMELGPDGALYVLDWHDADICGRKVVHGETGRIWRLTHRDAPPPASINLASLSDADLVKLHAHPNEWHARQARRLLQERALAGTLNESTPRSLRTLFRNASTAHHKLRALWSLFVVGAANDQFLATLHHHDNEYIRAWSIQLQANDRSVADSTLNQWKELAQADPSPVVRLYLASAMQRLEVGRRWEILSALAAHGEDQDDPNIPLLIWYALEPGIGSDTARALEFARSIRIPKLATFLARRMAGGTSAPDARPPFKPVKVEPAAAVSNDGLVVWYQANGVVTQDDHSVSQWTDGLRNGRHAIQPDPSARPALLPDLKGRPALRFDGVNDHLVLPHDPALTFASKDDYTVSIWVCVETRQNGWRGIVTKSRDQQPWYGAWIDPDGRWIFGASNANLPGPAAHPGWHHLCIVQEGSRNRRLLYLDGLLTAKDISRDGRGNGDLWIAGAKSTREFFQGGLGELQIYRRALSHPEVAFLAN